MNGPDAKDAESIRVSCVQFAPEFGVVERNVTRTEKLIRQASDRGGAHLVVLPELCSTGYAFESREELRGLSETIQESNAVQAWSRLAADLNIHIVAGFAERSGKKLFNSAVLVGPGDIKVGYRKTHLSDREKDLFDPGENGFVAHDTRLGRISMLICYDIWFPEALRACALAGADIICVPTNWSDLPEPQQSDCPMAIHLLMAGAHCNGVFIACANRVGTERGISFNGQSVIVHKSGWLIGDALTRAEENIRTADLVPSQARDKRVSTRNSVLRDRRADLYS